MSTKPNAKPLYRISFARIIGKDEHGKDVVGRPKEIGAVWPRKGDKKGGIIALDLIPVEMTQHQGVLFLVPVNGDENDADNGGSQ